MKKILFFALCAAVLVSACNNNETPTEKVETEVKTDTITETKVVEVPAVVDTAAIVAQYVTAHNLSKTAHAESKHKTYKQKQVRAVADPIIEYIELTPPPVPQAAAATETKVVVVHDIEKVYFKPDEKASFPGGEKAFDAYITKNLEYPQEALDLNVKGTVWSAVYLNEEGTVYKVTFPEARLGYGLNKEAERILLSSPRWNPAKHAGKPVKSKFVIPITYDIK